MVTRDVGAPKFVQTRHYVFLSLGPNITTVVLLGTYIVVRSGNNDPMRRLTFYESVRTDHDQCNDAFSSSNGSTKYFDRCVATIFRDAGYFLHRILVCAEPFSPASGHRPCSHHRFQGIFGSLVFFTGLTLCFSLLEYENNVSQEYFTFSLKRPKHRSHP